MESIQKAPNAGFVLDASIIVAIILQQEEAEAATSLLAGSLPLFIGAPTLLEARMVLLSRGFLSQFEAWWATMNVETLSFGQAHTEAATLAFQRFGKGRSSAKLNFGDCMAYATAQIANTALLYIGNDFDETDISRFRVTP